MNIKNDKVVWSGKIGGIVEYSPSNQPEKIFQKFARPPGTRSIIVKPNGTILLTKEFRQEIGKDDYRLPGGKVYDSLTDYIAALEAGDDLLEAAKQGAIKEVRQESAIEVINLELFKLSTSGGPTVEWDLYYFVTTEFRELNKQDLEEGEKIAFQWYSVQEVVNMCLNGDIQEDRSVAVILQFLHSIGKV